MRMCVCVMQQTGKRMKTQHSAEPKEVEWKSIVSASAPPSWQHDLTQRGQKTGTPCIVQVSPAGADDDVCAIAHCPINEATLDWMKGKNQAYFTHRREIQKGTLECGHSFSLMLLAYHFARNNMRCPVCRKGEDGGLTLMSLPAHIRGPFRKRICEMRHAENTVETAGLPRGPLLPVSVCYLHRCCCGQSKKERQCPRYCASSGRTSGSPSCTTTTRARSGSCLISSRGKTWTK